eukprot:UN1892
MPPRGKRGFPPGGGFNCFARGGGGKFPGGNTRASLRAGVHLVGGLKMGIRGNVKGGMGGRGGPPRVLKGKIDPSKRSGRGFFCRGGQDSKIFAKLPRGGFRGGGNSNFGRGRKFLGGLRALEGVPQGGGRRSPRGNVTFRGKIQVPRGGKGGRAPRLPPPPGGALLPPRLIH